MFFEIAGTRSQSDPVQKRQLSILLYISWKLFNEIVWWNPFITCAWSISKPILNLRSERKRTEYVIHIVLWAIIRDKLVMDSVTKSFRIILRCLPRNCIFFSLRALETFCGVKESWSSARRMETDILGKSCFKMNLSSEIGKTTRISELTSIAACSRYHVLTDSIALFFCIFNTHSPQFFLNRSDERLTLETSALETLYGGQITSSTQLIKPRYTAEEQLGMFFRLTY